MHPGRGGAHAGLLQHRRSPLYLGAVAVGMFGMPALGGTMALAHYLAAFLVGLTFRFYGLQEHERTPEPPREGNILSRALTALARARREDGRPVGQMLGDAIKDSMKTMALICGYIMLFATLARMIDVTGLFPYISAPFRWLFALFNIDGSLVRAAVTGFLEIDLGTLAASRAAGAPLVQQVAVAGAIIAWSGLSVHGQVASVLSGTDIRMGPYVAARLLHGSWPSSARWSCCRWQSRFAGRSPGAAGARRAACIPLAEAVLGAPHVGGGLVLGDSALPGADRCRGRPADRRLPLGVLPQPPVKTMKEGSWSRGRTRGCRLRPERGLTIMAK